MNYFKHSELADRYHVSLKTVHNWISAAKEGKISLGLYEAKSGTYVADTGENTLLLDSLAEKGKKYRNSIHHKVVKPKADFYKVYSYRQILDIINNIEIHREIPGQYNYLEEGARNWDNWMERLAKDTSSNILKGTIELLHENMPAIDRAIGNKKRINIVDLGVGNGYPIRELLGHLLEKNILHRYIGIDISPSMVALVQENIHKWYGDEVRTEGYTRDMTFERFDDLLVDDMLDEHAEDTLNMVLLFGATPANFRSYDDVIKTISESMGQNDLLLYTDKPDSETARKYFDFSAEKNNPGGQTANTLPEVDKYILDLIGIDEAYYTVEAGFNSQKHMRYIQIRLNTSLTIEFSIENGKRHVRLERGDVLLIFRIMHQTSFEMISAFEKAGLALIHSSLTPDRQYYFSISGVEHKQIDEY